jgi:hypothetical protein
MREAKEETREENILNGMEWGLEGEEKRSYTGGSPTGY